MKTQLPKNKQWIKDQLNFLQTQRDSELTKADLQWIPWAKRRVEEIIQEEEDYT